MINRRFRVWNASGMALLGAAVIAAGNGPTVHGGADKLVESAASVAPALGDDQENGFRSLFDGSTFSGWEGDQSVFRIENGAIVGGNLRERIPHNFFLAAEGNFDDFELRLEFMLKGDDTNAGVQIRSQRIPNHHEMIGYQADLGQNYWGCLYDESRRNKVLARPDAPLIAKALKPGEWNTYRIQCEGPRIRLWINDVQTVDYREEDPEIALQGRIAVQIHGGPAGEAWYRNIRIRPLSKTPQRTK